MIIKYKAVDKYCLDYDKESVLQKLQLRYYQPHQRLDQKQSTSSRQVYTNRIWTKLCSTKGIQLQRKDYYDDYNCNNKKTRNGALNP